MNFVFPYFLYAISAISIPIIIHLFNFRKYKKVYFSDVTFLKAVKLQNQSVNHLKQLLILLSRVFAILFLAFAFAQPYIPFNKSKVQQGEKNISVFIDNSFSMEALNTNGNLLEQAKKNAKEIALAFSPSDKFQILTQDFEAHHQRLVTREAFINLINEVKISANSNTFKDIIGRQKEALKNASGEKSFFIISDFQKERFQFNEIKNDTTCNYFLAPITANKPNNTFIDSIWFSKPYRQAKTPEELNLRVCNISEQNLENVAIKLLINNRQKAIASLNIDANQCVNTKLNFVTNENEIQNGTIEITDFPITYDDKFYFSYKINAKINVLALDGANASKAPYSIFSNDSLFSFISYTENNINYATFKNVDLIIVNSLTTISSGLNQELIKFVANKGSLVIFPGIDSDLSSYNTLLQNTATVKLEKLDTVATQVDYLNYQHPIFENVFEKKPETINLPRISAHYRTHLFSNSISEKIMSLPNGDAFFTLTKYKKGKIYLCTVPLNIEYSNFSKHALFVPLLYKLGINSVAHQNLYQYISKNNNVHINEFKSTTDNVFHITNQNNSFDIIPETRINNEEAKLFINNQIKEAGHYFVKNNQNEIIQSVAFNFNRAESKFEFWDENDLTSELKKNNLNNFFIVKSLEKSLTTRIKELHVGIKLWKYCLITALLFIACEIALIRFWKPNTI